MDSCSPAGEVEQDTASDEWAMAGIEYVRAEAVVRGHDSDVEGMEQASRSERSELTCNETIR